MNQIVDENKRGDAETQSLGEDSLRLSDSAPLCETLPQTNWQLPQFLHQREGHLTRELLREPGGFGLGQIPIKAKPDATVTSVCG